MCHVIAGSHVLRVDVSAVQGRGCLANTQRQFQSIVEVPAWSPSLQLHSLPSRLRKQPRWTLNLSVFSCTDAGTCPFSLSMRTCRCGRNLTCLATIVQRVLWLGSWGEGAFLSSALLLRSVTTNVHVRDMDLAVFNNLDGRRLEVVADGLTLWHGAQLAIDTTLVSSLHRDGSTKARTADHNGAVLVEARRRKERTYPELSGEGGRAWYSQPKLEADGTKRRPPSCQLWPRPKPLSRLLCCSAESKRHTFGDGVLCWHVLLPLPSRCPNWTVAQSMGQEQTSRQCIRYCGMPVFRRSIV